MNQPQLNNLETLLVADQWEEGGVLIEQYADWVFNQYRVSNDKFFLLKEYLIIQNSLDSAVEVCKQRVMDYNEKQEMILREQLDTAEGLQNIRNELKP